MTLDKTSGPTCASFTLLWAAVAACTVMPPVPERGSASYVVTDFAARAPIEVAILSPNEAPNFTTRDASLLREQVYVDLLAKGYTCLNPSFVDTEVLGREPHLDQLRDAVATDAFFSTEVLSVKEVPGLVPGVYRIEVRASLVDGVGTVLFDHQLPMTFEVDFGPDRELNEAERTQIFAQFVNRLLRDLPARRS